MSDSILDAAAASKKARECAAEEHEQKLRNAYYVLADVLSALDDERRESRRLRAELAAK